MAREPIDGRRMSISQQIDAAWRNMGGADGWRAEPVARLLGDLRERLAEVLEAAIEGMITVDDAARATDDLIDAAIEEGYLSPGEGRQLVEDLVR